MVKMLRLYAVALGMVLITFNVAAQTIFSENIGTPSATTAIASYSGWQNNGVLGFAGTADVRNTSASTGYTGASGGGNIFVTTTVGTYFEISNINTTSYTNLTLTLGHLKTTSAGNNELAIEVSSDGTNYTALSYSRATGTGTANWILITPTGTIPSTANLRIRFRQTSTSTQFRIDDIRLTGTAASGPEIAVSGNGNVITDGDVTPSATDHTAFGNVEVGGTPMTRTFTISNSGTGTLNLTGSPIVSISGSSMFTVTTQPSANSIASGGSPLTFVVTFTPTNNTAQTATISIANDDSDENPYNFDVSGTGSNSQLSDIEMDGGYSYSSNIDYTTNQGNPITNTSHSEGMFRFRVRDGGSAYTDNDTYGTTLNSITFSSVANIGTIRSAAIFNGNTMVANAPIINTGAGTIAFTGLSLAAADGNASAWYTLRVSFNNTPATIIDNAQLSFTIITAGVSADAAGSGFASFSVTSSTTGDRNRIEVTADRLTFEQQPTNTGIVTNMSPAVTVNATDINGVTDADATGTVSITSTGTMDVSPKTASLSAGVATFSTIYHTALGTGLTLSATRSGWTGATSSAFNITTIAYANGDYRTTGSGTWLSNSASPAIWERYTSGTWAASNSPAYNTSNSVYIQSGHTITTGGSFANSVNMKIMGGGNLTVGHSSTAGNMYIYDGGTLQINASFTMASTGTFEVEDNGNVNINFAYGTPATSIWQGTEIFHANSNLTLTDWDAANDFLIPSNTAISTNTYNGYTAVFGNVILDFASNLSASDELIVLASGTTINLAHGDLIFRTNAGNSPNLRLATSGTVTSGIGGDFIVEDTYTGGAYINMKTSGTLTFTITGNMQLDAATTRLFAGSSGTSTINVEGDLNITPSAVLDFNPTVAAGASSTLNLKGDLTVAGSGLLHNSNSSSNGVLNFTAAGDGLTAATTQTIDIASTGANENRYTNFVVKNGAYVQLINRNFELGNSSSLTVESGGVLDFGFTGTTALNLQEVTAGATSTSFAVNSGATIKITSADANGSIRASDVSGNVRTDTRTYNGAAIYHFIGKADQKTGDGLPTPITGRVIVELETDSVKLSINTAYRDINSPGYLEIRRGILLDNNDGLGVSFFDGSGELRMTGGIYRITSTANSLAGITVPRLSGTYTLSAGVVELNSATANTYQKLRGGPTYYKLIISGASSGTGYKTITNPISIVKNLQITGTTIFDITSWEMSGTAGLTMDAGLLRMSRTTGSPTLPQINGDSSAYALTGGTVEFYGTGAGNQHLIRGTYGNSQRVIYYNVEVNADAANETDGNVNAGASFDVNGVMNVNAPAILRLDQGDIVRGTGTVTIHDDAGLFYGNQLGITASGANGNVRTTSRTFGFGTYGFVSSAAMVSGNGLPAAVKKLFALRTNTTDVATMTNSVSVSQTLGFRKGVMATGTKKITVLNGATVAGASDTTGWVNGNLEKYIAAGASVTQNYEVGDAAAYAPATLTFSNVTDADSVMVSTVAGDHPSIASSTVDGSKSVNRYWKLTNGGVVFTNYNAVFNFNNPADLDGAAVGNHNSFIGGRYAGSGWTYPTVGTKTTTTTQLTGLTGFGDFQLGVLQTGVYIWTGAGADPIWTTPANWVGNTVPVNDCISNVNIPTVATYPVITTNVSIGNLYVSSGATISINADSLSVCGTLTGGSSTPASFAGNGKVVLKGSTQQLISGKLSFETLRLYNAAGAQTQTGAAIDIYTALEVPRGVFNVNGRVLKFKSQSGTDYAYLNNFGPNYTGSVSGNVTAELTVPGNNFQHLVGSPVSANLSQFGASGTAGYVQPVYVGALCHESRSAVGGPYGRVFSWEEDKPVAAPGADCPVYGWKVENNGANPAVPAKGYAAYIRGGTFSVTGSPNQNATYTVNNLSNTGYALNSIQHPTGDNFTSGWHLISNPFLAPYDILGSLQDGANSANFNDAQIWQATGPFSGTYQSVISGSLNDNMLAPFQGVMVHRGNGANFAAPSGTATFNFNKSFLREPTTPPQFYRQASREKLSIKVSGNGFMDITYVEFNDAATADFDIGYDSRKMFSAVGQPTIYTRQAGEMTSSNINHSISEVSTIPLGVSPGADGTFNLIIEGISTFDPTSYVYLEDRVTGIMLNVRNNSLYTFVMSEMDDSERFVLHFTPPIEVNAESSTCTAAGSITIEQPGTADWVYEIADGSQVISSGTLNELSPVTLSVNAGLYTLTLVDANGYTVVRDIEVLGAADLNAGMTVSTNTAETGEPIMFDNTSNGADVVWDFGDGTIISGISHMEYTYSEPGVYTVVLTVANEDGCTEVLTQQITITERLVSDVNTIVNESAIKLWSFGNRVFVDFSALRHVEASVEIFNVLGQSLSAERFGRSSVYTVTLSNLETAYVMVRVKNEDEIITKKLFISNR